MEVVIEKIRDIDGFLRVYESLWETGRYTVDEVFTIASSAFHDGFSLGHYADPDYSLSTDQVKNDKKRIRKRSTRI